METMNELYRLIGMFSIDTIRVIAVDFDGTLCEREKFPQIGKPKIELIQWLIQQQMNNKKLILWTCRENENLEEAVQWCKQYGLEFDAINENLPMCGIKTRKVIADIYIDDRACIPLYEDKKE